MTLYDLTGGFLQFFSVIICADYTVTPMCSACGGYGSVQGWRPSRTTILGGHAVFSIAQQPQQDCSRLHALQLGITLFIAFYCNEFRNVGYTGLP